MSIPAQTTGIGVAAVVAVDSAAVTLSLTGTTTHQIVPQAQDLAGTAAPGVALTLTAAATASGGTTVYTGTITGGGSNALAGKVYVVAGFVTGANNGTLLCTASSATTLTLDNPAGVAETHAGTATEEGASAFTFVSKSTAVATVSATGLITAVGRGNANVEVGYPTYDNTQGNAPNGWPMSKVYKFIRVLVTA